MHYVQAATVDQRKHTVQPLDRTSSVTLPFVTNVAKKRVGPRRRSLDLSALQVGSSLPGCNFATAPGPSINRLGSRLGARLLVPSIARSQAGLSSAASIATASTEHWHLPTNSRSMDFGKRRYARRASLPLMHNPSSNGTAQGAAIAKSGSDPADGGTALRNASIKVASVGRRVCAAPGDSALLRNQEIDAFPTKNLSIGGYW